MKYPNASKGLHWMIIAEFFALAASIIMVLVSVFAMPEVDAPSFDFHVFGTVGLFVLASVVLYFAAYAMEIYGIVRASKDEPAFRVSLYAIIAAIILTVLSVFFFENETIYLIISIGGDVAQFFLVHYIIHGIMHLANHLGRPEMAKKGTHIFRVIYIGIIFEVIVRLIEIFYGMKHGEELAEPFEVVANILKSVEYVLFLIYIVRGYKMLKESKEA